MCIFSHESIEKSLPHNLQEPNSRGEDNREESETPDVNEEDGEREGSGTIISRDHLAMNTMAGSGMCLTV